MNRTAIVSNRLPSLNRMEASAGGLEVGLCAALKEAGGTWFGWDGTVSRNPSEKFCMLQADPFTLAPLQLSEREHEGYYLGFANRTLWPLLHGRTDLVRFEPSDFSVYRAVNEKFAKCVAVQIGNHHQIWVHDYHLMFLGEELRRLGVQLPIGFFLHVPFPPPDILVALPCYRDVIKALSAYDLIGFQTENDVRNFSDFVLHHLGGVVSGDGTVFALGRRFKVGAFPIGIDTRRFERLAASKETDKHREDLRQCFSGKLGVVGVDRLDYTKGLPYRLRAFERMLEMAPGYRRRAFLLQISAPSREEVPEYIALRAELEALSGRINARHAEIDWAPVRYINRAFSQSRLAALYRLSRAGLVTPLKDGMNLVAKEYVAAQDPDDPGVLILSRFAGAAEQLTSALLVNPYDVDGVAKALCTALEMPLVERRARWSEMIVDLRTHDVHGWRDSFLEELAATRRRMNANVRQPASAEAALSARKGADDRDGLSPLSPAKPLNSSYLL